MLDRFQFRNDTLSDEAIQWLVRLGHEPTPGQRRSLEQWSRRSPAHAEALRQAQSLLKEVGHTEVAAEHRRWTQALAAAPRRGMRRRAFLAGGAAAACVAGLAGSGLLGSPSVLFADRSTRVGQRSRSALPDGSQAWLNTASAFSMDFSPTSRQVSLAAGELMLQIAADPQRAFVARCRDGVIRASSGHYALRCESRRSTLTVLSGTVEVRNAAGVATVSDDQRLAFSADVLGLIEAVNADELTAWVRGKLIFNRQSLAAIAAELERYVAGRVVVVGDRLRRLPLSGVFDLDDPDASLDAVATLARADIVRLPLLTLIR